MTRQAPFRGTGPRQRGVAALAVMLLLMAGMVVVAAWAQRNAVSALRSVDHQTRQAQAQEAAEAGLAWATGLLNAGPIDDACRPAPNAQEDGFEQRLLGKVDAGRALAPLHAGGLPVREVVASCAFDDGGWSCQCPTAAGGPPRPALAASSPGFAVHFEPLARPGQVQLVAVGCSRFAPPCTGGGASPAEAHARLRLTLVRLPRLPTLPGAALVAQGDIDNGAAALGLHAPDGASGAVAAHAGGRAGTAALRVSGPGGGHAALALKSDDARLRQMPDGALHARHLGMSVADWSALPGVQRIDCRSPCAPPWASVQALTAPVVLVHVQGDLHLSGPQPVGSAAHPVMLVVDGDLRLEGPVQLHGLVLARNLAWTQVAEGGGGLIKGAVVLSGHYQGDAAADLVYDDVLMHRLQRLHGHWVAVPGSWRDF